MKKLYPSPSLKLYTPLSNHPSHSISKEKCCLKYLTDWYFREDMSYSKAIEPFIQKYPSWVYFTGVGGRMLKENNWNTGIKKNIPKHYKVDYNCFLWPTIRFTIFKNLRKQTVNTFLSEEKNQVNKITLSCFFPTYV